jgi:uncharacterized membrane protein YhaH (DUF805 family)
MDYFWFLFRFEGRINCAKYWLATLSILCGMISVLLLLAILIIILGIGGPLAINLVVISASIRFTGEASLLPQIVIIPMTVFFAWRFAAASIKRLHDRNKSGWWLVPFFIAPSLLDKLADWLENPVLAGLAGALAFGLGVWCFVELFCLRGAKAPNRFGPDPLAPRDARPRWDQQSELEFVPHSAGPSPASHVKRGA